jgi:uncharacterized membrane protein YesL
MDNILGLLTLVPAVLYMYPAICAGVDLIRKYELKLCNTIFKEFFKSLKRIYLKALIETIFILICIVLFYISIRHFYLHLGDGIINSFGLVLSIAFAIMLLVIIVHLPLVMNYMEGCMIIDDIKLAGMMAFQDLAITLGIVIFIIADVAIMSVTPTLLIICGFSLPMYLLIKLTFKKYYVVYIRTHKEKE